MSNYKYKANQRISYDNGVLKGEGLVLGCSTTDQAVLGKGMIIKDLSGNIPTEEYPFDTMAVFEVHLKPIQ